MIQWVFLLGRHEQEQVRRRAAVIAAILARYDVTLVYRGLLKSWATEKGWRVRQTAAWAMDYIVVVEPSLEPRVRRQVADWSRAANPYLNDSAARTYATSLVGANSEDVLADLRLLASKPEHSVGFAVPQALVQLVIDRPDDWRLILKGLAAWTTEGRRCLEVQAARAVLFLAHLEAPETHQKWPALLWLAERDTDAWQHLKSLWCFALSDAMTTMRGWGVLLEWLLRADGVQGLADCVLRFANELLGEAPLLHRACRFYIPLWRSQHPTVPILQRLRPQTQQD
jgi:hypothetical protein